MQIGQSWKDVGPITFVLLDADLEQPFETWWAPSITSSVRERRRICRRTDQIQLCMGGVPATELHTGIRWPWLLGCDQILRPQWSARRCSPSLRNISKCSRTKARVPLLPSSRQLQACKLRRGKTIQRQTFGSWTGKLAGGEPEGSDRWKSRQGRVDGCRDIEWCGDCGWRCGRHAFQRVKKAVICQRTKANKLRWRVGMRSHGLVFWRTYYCRSTSPSRLANGFEGFCPFRLYVTIFNRQHLNLACNNTFE